LKQFFAPFTPPEYDYLEHSTIIVSHLSRQHCDLSDNKQNSFLKTPTNLSRKSPRVTANEAI
jgi:hypothetical protein